MSRSLPSAKERFATFDKGYNRVLEDFQHLEAQLQTKLELWESAGYEPAAFSKHEFLEGRFLFIVCACVCVVCA